MSRRLLEYKGYLGAIRFDADGLVLRGRIVNIDDIVTFQAGTVDEVIAEFKESVDDYLEQCAQLGQEPDRPFSGRLSLRMKPETHRVFQTYARARGKSLNGQIAKVLDREALRIQKRLGSAVVNLRPEPTSAGTKSPIAKKAAGARTKAK